MSLTEEGMRQRKWGSYRVLCALLENQEPSLSWEESMASLRPSTSYSEAEYWLDCLDIYRRLKGYTEMQKQSQTQLPLDKEQPESFFYDVKQLEQRVRHIAQRFAEVADDIERIRRHIL